MTGLAMVVLGALILLLIILIFWSISTQNQLASMDELCNNSLSQIGVQQQSRWDALSALADLTKGYSSYENDTLEKVIAARRNINADSRVSDVQNQENLLSKGFLSVSALTEAYPELKANAIYIKTMDSVNEYENNVRMSRMVYNDTVTKLNRAIRSFPGSLVAGMLRFTKKDYLQIDPSKQEMPSFK